MAWPMLEWVLDQLYAHLHHQQPRVEASILVFDAGESQLLDLMQDIVHRFPQVKLFCLPQLDTRRTIELGVKGDPVVVLQAMAEIQAGVGHAGYAWQPQNPEDKNP